MQGTISRPSGQPSILVVDDEPALVDVLTQYLRSEGFTVLEARNGRTAIELALHEHPQLALLDLNLPDLSGIEVFREIRAVSSMPIIMVTARKDEVDRIVGLELGADDYVTKPFSPREVVARVKAVLRRARRPERGAVDDGHDVVRLGALTLDRTAHDVRRDGVDVHLTPMEFRILDVLCTNAGRALTREQIIGHVSTDGDIFDRTLDRHIGNLRQKIEEDPARPRLVVTVVGVGYKLVEPLSD